MQLLKNPNFLILDEPTNDLDIHTLNLLEEFLIGFGGCLIVVSHDRYFMDKLVDHVFVFEGNAKIKDYYGNYTDYYRVKLAEEARAARHKAPLTTKPAKESIVATGPRKPTYKEKTEFENLEAGISEMEKEKENLMARMNSGYCPTEEFEQVAKDFARLEREISDKTDRWLELSSLFE